MRRSKRRAVIRALGHGIDYCESFLDAYGKNPEKRHAKMLAGYRGHIKEYRALLQELAGMKRTAFEQFLDNIKEHEMLTLPEIKERLKGARSLGGGEAP